MFQTGLSIAQIAENRGLVDSTIAGHLAFWVQEGQLEIKSLLSPEKLQVITQKCIELKDTSLSEIKNALGEEYTYSEIKLAQAHLEYLEKASSSAS